MTDAVLTLHRVSIPLSAPFRSGDRSVQRRDLVLVEIAGDGVVGWGEAAPYPGHTLDDIDDAWKSLVALDPRTPLLHQRPASQTASSAIEAAVLSLRAAGSGVPLGTALGACETTVRAGAAVGLHETVDDTIAAVRRAIEAGHTACKVKLEPGHEGALAAVREAFPQIELGADANGAYGPGPVDGLLELDRMDLAFIEQPHGAEVGDEAHRLLREKLDTPVALDESLVTAADVSRAIDLRTADILTLKPGRLGVATTRWAIAAARDAGIGVRIGGLVHSAVGQAVCVALAALDGVTSFGDLTGPPWLLETDVAAWRVESGRITVFSGPGLGIDVDLTETEVLETFTTEVVV